MRRRIAGFTLIELMVAVALMVVVVMYLLQSFSVQHRTYNVVDDMSEAQQNVRAIAALIERETRHAGFMVPSGAAACAWDRTNGPDTLYISDSDSLDPTGQLEPDLGARVTNGFQNNSTPDTLTVDSTTLDGTPFYDNDGDGTNDTDFRINGGAIIVDWDNPGRGRACGVVTGVSGTTLDIDFQTQMNGGLGFTTLMVVPAHVYQVNAATMFLTRNGDLLAGDVEDLQLAFFYDLDDDGAPAGWTPTTVDEGDGSEYPGTSLGAVFDPGSAAWTETSLRELRLNFVVRGQSADPNPEWNEGTFQATENRVPIAGNDRFRRRVHRAVIRTRNVGGRDIL